MQGNYTPDVANALAATEIKSFSVAALTAGTDLAETVLGAIGPSAGLQIGKVTITPTLAGGALTASDTLFVTFTLNKRTAAGSPVVIASGTTKTSGSGGTGSWVAWTPVSIPVVAGAAVAPGDVITLAITHASSGTAVPVSVLELFTSVN